MKKFKRLLRKIALLLQYTDQAVAAIEAVQRHKDREIDPVLVGLAVDFTVAALDATHDGIITDEESSTLMTAHWALIKGAAKAQATP